LPSQPGNESLTRHHTDAEDAVHRLERAGIPMQKISIIGRNFELREDVQGYYRPSDAALEGAGFGACRVPFPYGRDAFPRKVVF
jgi:hypothetical protein